MNELLLGFTIGLFFCLIIHRILYELFKHNFKIKGNKHNLKTIRCKTCRNYFYILDFETTKECCNCISLNIDD